jgi:hypothetical protein
VSARVRQRRPVRHDRGAGRIGAQRASRPPRSRSPTPSASPAVTSVVIGARTADHLADNLAAAELTLTAAERAAGQGERAAAHLPLLAPGEDRPGPALPRRPVPARPLPVVPPTGRAPPLPVDGGGSPDRPGGDSRF